MTQGQIADIFEASELPHSLQLSWDSDLNLAALKTLMQEGWGRQWGAGRWQPSEQNWRGGTGGNTALKNLQR